MNDVSVINVELDNSTFIIKYPEVTYSYFKSLREYKNDEDICTLLDNLLVWLDCSIVYNSVRIISTNKMNYDNYVSEYYYYLLHFVNQYYYNEYFDLLILLHIQNLEYEANIPIKQPVINKSRDFNKIKSQPKYIRQVTTDLITNKEVYKYINKKTGEIITSDDPDMLETLNSKSKKEKAVKATKVMGVPLSAMKFTFKKN